jgi:hypothetical protein
LLEGLVHLIPSTNLFQRLRVLRRLGGFVVQSAIHRPCVEIGSATSRCDVASSILESIARPRLACHLDSSLPSAIVAACDVGLLLGLFIIVKGEVEIESQSVPYALPDANPVVRGLVMTGYSAAAVNPGSRTCGGWSSSGRRFQHTRVLYTGMTIPWPAGGHSVEASAEDVAELLTTVTVHELRCIAKLITDHACVIAAVVLQCVVVVVLDDHGRVDVGDLLFVLHSILG